MPELDGVSIISLASFFVLLAAWLVAPSEAAKTVVVSQKMATEAVAA